MAGVSVASVSRILNNDETFSINENTRKRVIEIANQLNYSKDKSFSSSREAGDKNTIAIITRHNSESERNDPYFMMIRNGIEKRGSQMAFKTVRVFSMRDQDKDLTQLAKVWCCHHHWGNDARGIARNQPVQSTYYFGR